MTSRRTEKEKELARRVRELTVENRRLKQTLELRQNNITLLNLINANMQATLRPLETYYMILTAVTAQCGMGFNRAMLFLREPAENRLFGAMAISPDNVRQMRRFYEEAEAKRFDFSFYLEMFYRQDLKVKNELHRLVTSLSCPMTEMNIATSALADRKVRIHDRPRAADFHGLEKLRPKMKKEFAVCPILSGDESLGVIVCDHHFTDRPITADDLQALQTLSEFAASLIMIARKYAEAEQLSTVDELTQIWNFRSIRRRIAEEASRCKRYNRIFSLVMFDIDNFKHFNDHNGHLTGNRALMDVAEILRSATRTVDIPGRYGGEEFVLLLPETDRPGARRVAEKVLEKVRRHRFIGGEQQPGGSVTISGGIASYPDDGEDFESLVENADQRLYRAKAAGKDRVES